MQDLAFMAGIGPWEQVRSHRLRPGNFILGERKLTRPMQCQAAGRANAGVDPGGTASAMWEIRCCKAGATARSSTAARTAGLREITGGKTLWLPAPQPQIPPYSHAR